MTSPGGTRPSSFARKKAASSIATPPFMSRAPRPRMNPSARFPSNGGYRHRWFAVETTSTCP